MSGFKLETVKGIERVLLAENLHPDRLHLHISEIGPGMRAHAPHAHSGVEAIYILEGEGTMETGGEAYPFKANEAIVVDCTQEHGLINTGSGPLRYLVIITKDVE
jgi:mannose-6-phosphate isomerase-like protein (cupin superfamily)